MIRNILKKLAFGVLANRFRIGYRIVAVGKAKRLSILNLHRVQSGDSSAYPPLEPQLFDELLCFLKQSFTMHTFDELAELANSSGSGKPPLILSFDDGYRDFVEVTVPILERHRIRVNQNIIPECAETGLPPLNVTIQDFIGKATDGALSKFAIPGFPRPGRNIERERYAVSASHFVKNQPISTQNQIRAAITAEIGEELLASASAMMTVEEIRQIAMVHEVGAHSFSHANMGVEDDRYVQQDLNRCRTWFKDRLGFLPDIYAFPNGSYRPEHIDFALDAGYLHILLVNDRFSNVRSNVHQRFGFDARSRAEMRFRALGGLTNVRSQ